MRGPTDHLRWPSHFVLFCCCDSSVPATKPKCRFAIHVFALSKSSVLRCKKPRSYAVFCCLFLHPAKTLGLCGGIAMFSPFCPSFCPLPASHKGHFLTPHSPACPTAWLSPFWSLFQRGHRHSWLYECQRAPAALVHPWRLPPPPLYLIFQTIQMGGNAHGHTIRAQKNANGSVESWLKKVLRACGMDEIAIKRLRLWDRASRFSRQYYSIECAQFPYRY